MPLKIAVPDMVSNSYFPAVAAVELGFFKEEGLDVALELIFPVDKTYAFAARRPDRSGRRLGAFGAGGIPGMEGRKTSLRPGPGHVLVPGHALRPRPAAQ